MFRKSFRCAAVAVLAINVSHAHELGAHVHGVAPLQAAVDERSLTLDFSSPPADMGSASNRMTADVVQPYRD